MLYQLKEKSLQVAASFEEEDFNELVRKIRETILKENCYLGFIRTEEEKE